MRMEYSLTWTFLSSQSISSPFSASPSLMMGKVKTHINQYLGITSHQTDMIRQLWLTEAQLGGVQITSPNGWIGTSYNKHAVWAPPAVLWSLYVIRIDIYCIRCILCVVVHAMNVIRHLFLSIKAWKILWGLLISVARSELGNGKIQHDWEAGGWVTGRNQVSTTAKLDILSTITYRLV